MVFPGLYSVYPDPVSKDLPVVLRRSDKACDLENQMVDRKRSSVQTDTSLILYPFSVGPRLSLGSE